MASTRQPARVATVAVVEVASAAACGGSGSGSGSEESVFTNTSKVVSDPTTRDIQLLAPEAEGTWPVVMAMHGNGGSGQDMVELGRADAVGERRWLAANPDASGTQERPRECELR
jgi:poly(3-hydroxybutyrate) depolymerase